MLILIKAVQIVIFIYGLYFLTVALAGLFTRRIPRVKQETPMQHFAVIVPAHNEEKVIGSLLENLKDLHYPSTLYDILVIADHCSDGTAAASRALGAAVWERSDRERGKGSSLQEAMALLGFTAPRRCAAAFSTGSTYSGANGLIPRYDAAVIIDADNLVAPNFLQVMNNRLQAGEKLIQSSIDAKNPNDNWVTSVFSVNFWLNNRFILQARYNLRLSSLTAGTGVCIAREVLEKTGYTTVTLTEDLEFAVQALLKGFRATFARETRVYDEKPRSFKDACHQRLRWARGQINVARLYAPRLLLKGLLKADRARLESGLRLLQLPVVAAGFTTALLAPVLPQIFRDTSLYYQLGSNFPALGLFFASLPYLLPLLALLIDRLSLKPFRYFFLYPFFYLSWVVLIFYAFCTFRRRIWVPGNHTCSIDYRQLPTWPHPDQVKHYRTCRGPVWERMVRQCRSSPRQVAGVLLQWRRRSEW